MGERVNYLLTVFLYLVGGGSAILITLIITPHLNNNLDSSKLNFLGVFLTYFGIGLGLTSFSISNSLVMFKARSKKEFKDIITNSPFYFLFFSVLYGTSIFIFDERFNIKSSILLILMIWLSNLYTLSNNYYQSLFKKWKSFRITIFYSLSFVLLYFILWNFFEFDPLYMRIIIPVIIYGLLALNFYYQIYKKKYIVKKIPSKAINSHIKNIFFHTLFGIFFTQTDKLMVINFFNEQSSINYIYCSMYFSPLLVFGLQYNNAFKPLLFKNIKNRIVTLKLISNYILSTLLVSVLYYFSIEFYLNFVIKTKTFNFYEYSLQICVLFSILNVYNPFGAIHIYFRNEKFLSVLTFIGTLLTVITFLFTILNDGLSFIIPAFIIIQLMYVLVVGYFAIKNLKMV